MRILFALAIAGCSVGSPPGFSNGSQWTFPLVDPLDDGLLVTPVTINGKGPFLFAIDPDANALIVDEKVVVAAGMRLDRAFGPKLLDETDTSQVRFFGEVLQLQVGTLSVENRSALVVKHGTYYVPGRDIDGVLGRSVVSDSLVFGFDRDRGVGWLATQQAFHPPAGAVEIHYDALDAKLNGDVQLPRDPGSEARTPRLIRPVPRRLAKATVDGVALTMHLDLGAVTSQLRDPLWTKAQLAAQDRTIPVLDETGTAHEVTRVGVAPHVVAGGASADQVVFLPYVEKRWDDELVDGALGLGFFQRYTVAANWDRSTFYLTPRAATPGDQQARLGRWNLTCANPGCVTVHAVDPLAGKPLAPGAAHPGIVLTITRDPGAPAELEVVLAATNRPDLPRLTAQLPAGVDHVMEHLRGEWAGAQLVVVDASPYPRRCPGGCVISEP